MGEIGKLRFVRPILATCIALSAAVAVADDDVVREGVASNELAIARQALRDGLHSVARNHAARVQGESARLIVLESFAKEANWQGLLEMLDGWDGKANEAFRCYRALALLELGRLDEARGCLAEPFALEAYRPLGERLRARLEFARGNAAEAVRLMEALGVETLPVEAKMELSDMRVSAGDQKGAAELWREVVTDTNAEERAFVTAALNLGEVGALRTAYARAEDATLRRAAGFRLGRSLIDDKATFAEGEKLIRQLVKDAPDAEGARAAYAHLANAYLAASRWQAAADLCRDEMEMWPEAAKDFATHSNRGWALLKLGRRDEALEAFVRAEKCAVDDEDRATVIVKQGDILNDLGQTETAMVRYRAVLDRYPATRAAKLLERIIRLRELETEGRQLYREFRFAEAQATFAKVAESDPSRQTRMEYFIALCLYGQGKDDDAERKADRIATQGDDPVIRAEATLWLAKLAYNRGKWAAAHARFADYAAQKPDSTAAPEALLWAARAAFAEDDFSQAISNAAQLVSRHPDSPLRTQGFLVQGESLIELARFDEAVLVLERSLQAEGLAPSERERAQVLRADALFAMGADNPGRYAEALEAYRTVRQSGSSSAGRVAVSFKVAKTLEKLRRLQEALDVYYTDVILAYRDGRLAGERFDDESRAAFSRAAFRLADEFVSRGHDDNAVRILRLVVTSDVPAAAEAERRIRKIKSKGGFL